MKSMHVISRGSYFYSVTCAVAVSNGSLIPSTLGPRRPQVKDLGRLASRVGTFSLNFNLNVTSAFEILGLHVVQELTETPQFPLLVHGGARLRILTFIVFCNADAGFVHN
ncbi:hypothetical protein ABIB45_003283 [Arthrobacter sp. UYCo732]